MSFFHFLNCVGLAYAPFFIVYKYSGLSEYTSFWRCIQASVGYFLTQLVKLLIVATFFPAPEADEFNITFELIRSSADFIDVIGLHIIMSRFLTGKGEVRFISGGLGWGAAHSFASRIVLFWVGARASAFSWKWIQLAIDSSSDMLLFLAMAALTWFATRASNRSVAFVFLSFATFHSFFYQVLMNSFHVRGWLLVASKIGYSIVVSMGAIYSYSSFGSPTKRE